MMDLYPHQPDMRRDHPMSWEHVTREHYLLFRNILINGQFDDPWASFVERWYMQQSMIDLPPIRRSTCCWRSRSCSRQRSIGELLLVVGPAPSRWVLSAQVLSTFCRSPEHFSTASMACHFRWWCLPHLLFVPLRPIQAPPLILQVALRNIHRGRERGGEKWSLKWPLR